tara:strand:+ start:12278 stop:13048 length:771 start_codon:yes stop_codon:yes gene_type:complete
MTNERQAELFPAEGNSPSTEPTEEVLINDRTSAETSAETTTETQADTLPSTTTEGTQVAETTETAQTKSVDDKPTPAWSGLSAQQEREARETQQKLTYYEEQQRQNTIHSNADAYKKQLEDQGYMPEQAQQISDMQVQQANRDHDMQNQYKTQLDHMRGKFAAVTQFSKDYGIPPDDLMRFEDPQSMETFAKKEKKIKDLENELAGYKDKQVPPQSYDNSQADPSASTSEDRLLDLYNQGVRNSDTEAAARRATGL